MRVVCFSAQSLAQSAAVMAGVQPLTSPPITFQTFDPHVLEGCDLIFFNLHGLAGQPYWYGDGLITAVSAAQIAAANLRRALVFAANCYGGRTAPMVQALLDAGVRGVVIGEGQNTVGVSRVLGRAWRVGLQTGLAPNISMEIAKFVARARFPHLARDVDSFHFIQGTAAI